MSVKFYMDVHVPFAVTEALGRRGVEVLTAQEDGAGRMQDPDLLDRATALGQVLVTPDQGFLREAALRQRAGQEFTGLIFAHQLRVSIGQLIEDLELIAKAATSEEYTNRVEHLPLR